MKIVKLGLEWGAAYEEAVPIRISHGAAVLEVYVSERHELVVQAVDAHVTTFTRNGVHGLELTARNL